MLDILLLETLEDLGKEDFGRFKWFLNHEIVDGCKPIPVSKLEDANQLKTVTQMISSYGKETAVNVTVAVLKKMRNNHAAEKLMKNYTGEMTKAAPSASSSSSSAAAAPPAVATMSAQNGSVIIAPSIGGTVHTMNFTVHKRAQQD